LKQIDKLLLKSFVGPFFVSFGVALFVLIMQFLWLYIDEIAGKGVSIFIMLELIGYLSVSTFPMALPIAVLISSVMVMGNLAERYELSSFKSAGVSLMRVMVPLIFTCISIALFSFFCSDYLIPKANLQFRSRLFDIRKQKPALSIEKGTFNEDFRLFIIRVGKKEKDGETIGDVIIEDQTNNGKVKFNQILSDSGQMFTTADKRFFVMNLFNGAQYQEPGNNGMQQKQKFPFVRTNFKSWQKVWDMQEFEMNPTDRERFSTQRSMLTMQQLKQSVDSLETMMWNGKQEMASDLLLNLKRQPLLRPTTPATQDTSKKEKPKVTRRIRPVLATQAARAASGTSVVIPPSPANQSFPPGMPIQELSKTLPEYPDFLATFPEKYHKDLLEDALRQVKLSMTTVDNRKQQIITRKLEAAKTGYELYTKHSFALVCIVFLFIGGPMGAIIRKGGFGYPILVSIIFFVTFVFLTILCRKLAESFVLTPFWAAMMPCVVMMPIGAFLTSRAVNDVQLFSTDRIDKLMRWIGKKVQRNELKTKH
jgi:lipopolysaccharide export system permease protein